MKDPGDESYQDDKSLLDDLFGDAVDAEDADDAADVPPVVPSDGSRMPVAHEAAADSVALPEPGLPEPGLGQRRSPAWQGAIWARSGVPSAGAPGCREIGLTTTGFVIFMIVDSIMMYAPFRTHSSTNLLPQAITLALLAFGLGALMIWSIRGAFRPVGVGLMLGWVFMTLISAGYFTGLNP
ncbi:MAG TPA: hypothetical protein VE465_01875 [Streptosporangiaceae bacterium]|jgi:hypothetical protein|nr:hypothetical protein [Streptosporangiaceae bacterium]